MFSKKYFSLKKWLLLTIGLFLFTFAIAYALQLTGETREELVSSPSLLKRLLTSSLTGFVISFMRATGRKL